MKATKRLGTALAAVAVTTGLLLGVSAASAAEVVFGDPTEPNKATKIQNLIVGGNYFYNVTFNIDAIAAEIYGPFPGDFPIFNTADAAQDAVLAVNAALQEAGAFTVGEDSGEGSPIFNIGYDSWIVPIGDIETVKVWRGIEETGEWINGLDNDWSYNLDAKTYAVFTVTGVVPDQFNLTVNKAGEGSGLVTSEPPGINCPTSCGGTIKIFEEGTSVTLTATPDTGSTFTSWSGCNQTQAKTCTVVMTAAKTVTATFAQSGGPSKGINPGIQGLILED